MQIEISNEIAAQIAATAAGFPSVEDFVNNLIKRESDLLQSRKDWPTRKQAIFARLKTLTKSFVARMDLLENRKHSV